MVKNRDVRAAAVAAGVPLYAIAAELGISEATLYRRLRKELLPQEKTAFLVAVNNLSQGVQ